MVGARPAGLECARALGLRGYEVTLAEARNILGGRVADESRMPGLATWGRGRDYRMQQIQLMANVQTYLGSRLEAQEILEFGSPKVVLATGGTWRRDGVGRWHTRPLSGLTASAVFTPEDVFAGRRLEGPVVIFDDDRYYLGGVLGEKLRQDGLDVTLVTPAAPIARLVNPASGDPVHVSFYEATVVVRPPVIFSRRTSPRRSGLLTAAEPAEAAPQMSLPARARRPWCPTGGPCRVELRPTTFYPW